MLQLPCQHINTSRHYRTNSSLSYLRQRWKHVLPVSVCCLCARLLKKACIDLDDMLRVDRCRDMDELMSPIRIIVRMPDCFLRYSMRCNAKFYYVGKIPPIGLQRRVVLKWFYSPPVQRCVVLQSMVLFTASRRNNYVGGICALQSAF